jgi:hypothetical protein
LAKSITFNSMPRNNKRRLINRPSRITYSCSELKERKPKTYQNIKKAEFTGFFTFIVFYFVAKIFSKYMANERYKKCVHFPKGTMIKAH